MHKGIQILIAGFFVMIAGIISSCTSDKKAEQKKDSTQISVDSVQVKPSSDSLKVKDTSAVASQKESANQVTDVINLKNKSKSIEHYHLSLPKDYRQNTAKSYPTIIFLSGSGAKGFDIASVIKEGTPVWVKKTPDFPFIVVSPQLTINVSDWTVEPLQALYKEITEKYRVDLNRVYLVGYSFGGVAAWEWAYEYPDQFAALTTASSYGNPSKGCIATSLPVWAFHNDGDPVLSLSADEQTLEAFKKCGGNMRLTVMQKRQHDAWNKVFQDSTVYNWLLTHTRKANLAAAAKQQQDLKKAY